MDDLNKQNVTKISFFEEKTKKTRHIWMSFLLLDHAHKPKENYFQYNY